MGWVAFNTFLFITLSYLAWDDFNKGNQKMGWLETLLAFGQIVAIWLHLLPNH